MRNVLTVYLVGYLLLDLPEADRPAAAKEVFHVFVMGVYFFPLLGGWLSDRFLGKYRTILYLSLLYCLGHAFLAVFEGNKAGFYAGLGLIALGSGGIKPCVSAFVGDQFDQSNKHLARVVFDAFYWIINFGSFFASLLIPLTLKAWGPSVAFGIPGVLMFIATVIFWLGRDRYVVVPPAPSDPHTFFGISRAVLSLPGPGRALAIFGLVAAVFTLFGAWSLGPVAAICLALVMILGFAGSGLYLQLGRAGSAYPAGELEAVRSVLKVLVIFALVTPFWSLFDQKASTWVLQAQAMTLPGWSWFQSPSQMQALNPLLVMMLIPFNNLLLFPLLRKMGWEPTPLRRMTAGMAIAGFSWVVVGGLQVWVDGGATVSILWQIAPYLVLTTAEVLVSATGLEFAYSQAPQEMKGVLMSFWSLAVTVGNLWVILVNAVVKREGTVQLMAGLGSSVTAVQMFFFAGFAFAAALAFAAYALRYRTVDHYRR
ncbi:MAG: MFS transporter [Deltaproteobacteria bacterium]|nr:MFS transporter [Deltaproteobacteria bacterium]